MSSVATAAGRMPRAAKNASTFSLVSLRAISPAMASTGSDARVWLATEATCVSSWVTR